MHTSTASPLSPRPRTSRLRNAIVGAAMFAAWSVGGMLPLGYAQQQFVVQLRNGMRLGPGVTTETDSITTNNFQLGGGGAGKPILVLDDGLRRTYVNLSARNVISNEESIVAAQEQLELPSAAEAARSGGAPAILNIMAVSEFNKYGRRTYTFNTTRGRVDVLQGITLLTPTFAKVEVLRTGTEEFVWDQRIATSSIPAPTLREILNQALDLSKSADWLRLVSFYMQAERYQEASDVMMEALTKFPSQLAERRAVVQQLDQMLASQKFDEIKLRRNSGQQQLAKTLLGSFPVSALSSENQVKLDDEIKTMQQQVLVVADIVKALQEQVAQLPAADQQLVQSVVQEIAEEVNLDSIVRFDDFQRLRRDTSIPAENLVSYAIGGWLLGPGAGIDNFAVAKSLVRVRAAVIEYLNEADEARRQQILRELAAEEGADPARLSKLLAIMKPPQALPNSAEGDPEGLCRLSVRLPGQVAPVDYVVQVPPEYDPNRKYPCILALPGRGESPELEINWWCGINVELNSGEYRFGQATRYGYIVVSPDWMTPNQGEYQYTEGEHARILACLRDAFRKLSIDTDRVFLSGHFDGATAAWDLALAHPDLWAGAIMLSPGADKYIVQYTENIRTQAKNPDQIPLGTYIVYGELDGTRNSSDLGNVATRYLTTPAYDTMVVEYRGQGRGHFSAELPRIMEWMQLSSHRRIRNPQFIEARTMRSGDRFFYWLEAPSLLPKVAGNPIQFVPANYGMFEARRLESAINGVMVSSIPSPNRSAIVWLTPEMVDFGRKVTITIAGDRHNLDLAPDIGVMLEDVRGRGDRMHVFWQKVVF